MISLPHPQQTKKNNNNHSSASSMLHSTLIFISTIHSSISKRKGHPKLCLHLHHHNKPGHHRHLCQAQLPSSRSQTTIILLTQIRSTKIIDLSSHSPWRHSYPSYPLPLVIPSFRCCQPPSHHRLQQSKTVSHCRPSLNLAETVVVAITVAQASHCRPSCHC